MCGINGLIGFNNSLQSIRAMNDAIAHRGPDAEGEWSSDEVAFGHRRLSIIDLSASANQPLVKDGLVIVYNGEVYNYKELRAELVKRGINFKTNSDTEVVLELFRLYREFSFSKLIGMFAFAVYDQQTKELFLVRDYFGIKPLYYSFLDQERLVFSSEIKAVIRAPGIKKEINPYALSASLNYLWIPSFESIFKDIFKLKPAHFMKINTFKPTETKQESYWQLKPSKIQLKPDKALEQLKDVLERSVKRHLVSDVPVGAFLSGGLDSSLISVMAKKINPDLSTYTITLSQKDKQIEKMPDDNLYALRLAKQFDLNHKDVKVEAKVINSLPDMVYSLDEPIGDPAAINTYLICKLAKESGIKVLLSGMGADEIFAGYRRQYAVLLANRLTKTLGPLGVNLLKSMASVLPVRIGNKGLRRTRWLKRFLSFTGLPIDQAYMRSYSYYSKKELSTLLNHTCDDQIEKLYSQHHDMFYQEKEFDNINRMCHTDINMFMVGLNLTYTDRASMAASVETRVPFIDKEVIEFALSLPGDYKIKQGQSKHILKKAALSYLPKNIVHRPKASFGMPIRSWIHGDLKEMVNDLLSSSIIKKRGFLNPQEVEKMIDSDRKGIEDNAYKIYQLLTLELWCQRFLD